MLKIFITFCFLTSTFCQLSAQDIANFTPDTNLTIDLLTNRAHHSSPLFYEHGLMQPPSFYSKNPDKPALSFSKDLIRKIDFCKKDNMPILNPQGSFSLVVIKPDSSIINSLLIKKSCD